MTSLRAGNICAAAAVIHRRGQPESRAKVLIYSTLMNHINLKHATSHADTTFSTQASINNRIDFKTERKLYVRNYDEKWSESAVHTSTDLYIAVSTVCLYNLCILTLI